MIYFLGSARMARPGAEPAELRGTSRRVATAASRRALRSALIVLSLSLAHCDEDRRPAELGPAPASPGIAPPPPARARVPVGARTFAAKPYRVDSPPKRAVEAPLVGADLSAPEGVRGSSFVVDRLVDVAAAGPATATPRGVVLFDRANRLWLARRFPGPSSRAAEPRASPIAPLPAAAGPFPLSRAAAVRRQRAYWVSRGRLLSESLSRAGSGRSPVVLRDDARPGTRVATPIGAAVHLREVPEMAAYVARPDDVDAPARAQLWVAGRQEVLTLTPDLASASSVALVVGATGLHALFLEARTGMSIMHVRQVIGTRAQDMRLGEDHAVWVGGPARATTEIDVMVGGATGLSVWMPLERDITHFGLVRLGLDLPAESGSAETSWWLYDNGIEPAPLATTRLCGQRVLVAARPSSAQPGALQQLVLRSANLAAAAPTAILARSRAFFDVSLSPLGRGALLTYVADHRTWARTLRCNSP